MTTIYCICSGEYSDWNINYSFASKDKRDKLLSFLGTYYNEYNIELDDDKINVDNIKDFYVANIYMNDNIIIDYHICNNIQHDKPKSKMCRGKLHYIELLITKEIYDKGECYYKEKYTKVWHDTVAKVKYIQSEGITDEDIEEILNNG